MHSRHLNCASSLEPHRTGQTAAPSASTTAATTRGITRGLLVSCLSLFSIFALPISSGAAADTTQKSKPAKDWDNGSTNTTGAQEPYNLGPQDKVRVMVFEWRPSRDEIFAWSALNAEYTVGPSGNLALPLIGDVPAAGVTTEELSKRIGQRLRDRMGLATAPDTAVEVTIFRPFYVAGSVEKPGEYPYRPGLTVLQAVSISGGMRRVADASMLRLQRDSLSTRGDLELLDKERDALLARKARLEAEFKRLPEITFPPELLARAARDPSTNNLVEQERIVFGSRKSSFDMQMKTLSQLKDFLEKEIESNTGQLESHRRQIDLVKQELTGVVKLASKGLVTAPRKLALERNLAQLEGDGLRMEGNVVKVRQDLSRNDIAMVELETKRSSDVAAELQTTQFQLEQTTHKKDTARKLLYESEVVAPGMMADRGKQVEPNYKIVRRTGGGHVQIDANENTLVLPGDTVKVEVPFTGDPSADLPAAPEMPETPVAGRSGKLAPIDTTKPKRAALNSSSKQRIAE
ncbi:polysaccharide biosynthesis/export family protein [Hyphomicrobium sp. NDB2Meth4]|uniref:polysaccharide biosynthesis/export family protein n=1 Tax=Hyphomicrobium sp. NDB2Meth4 TaxID=1892846 RepID=UPI0009308FF1|nr:polysaccharide biosynthesis/export family protein [Hyphomicrobium sp. NDB2Meth4]